jgi:hypothetical protein
MIKAVKSNLFLLLLSIPHLRQKNQKMKKEVNKEYYLLELEKFLDEKYMIWMNIMDYKILSLQKNYQKPDQKHRFFKERK